MMAQDRALSNLLHTLTIDLDEELEFQTHQPMKRVQRDGEARLQKIKPQHTNFKRFMMETEHA